MDNLEEFETIKEFPGSQFQINRLGQVRNIKTGRILKGSPNSSGYIAYTMIIDGKAYTRMAHRMVAEQFIQNPENKPIVNHLDENKMNPAVWNLEWVTYAENTRYGTAMRRSIGKRSNKINEYNLDGKRIRTWRSTKALCRYYKIPCDNSHRPSYLTKIINNNSFSESEKIVFADRVFMKADGRKDWEDFDLALPTNYRNSFYASLKAPENVPDEYLSDAYD